MTAASTALERTGQHLAQAAGTLARTERTLCVEADTLARRGCPAVDG